MPNKRRRPTLSPGEVVSSSEESDSSGEDTDSTPSPPPTQAPRGTPERADHHARRNDRQSPRRQPVERLGPPRPVPSDRQMRRLDVEWEMRQLERARREQPEAFGRRRASEPVSSAWALSDSHYLRQHREIRRMQVELRRLQNDPRLDAVRRRPEPRELHTRVLKDDNARTMLRIHNTPIIALTLLFIRTPTLSTTPRPSTSPHSHY